MSKIHSITIYLILCVFTVLSSPAYSQKCSEDSPAPPDWTQLPADRIVLGTVVAATSGSDPSAKLFADATADFNIGGRDISCHTVPWLWVSGRVSSIPQSTTVVSPTQLTTIFTSTTTSSAQPQQLVQSGELETGGALQFWSHKQDRQHWATLSAILGGGAVTPLSTGQAIQQLAVYNATPDVQSFYSQGQYSEYQKAFAAACTSSSASSGSTSPSPCYVAFIPQDRARFFRNYAGGFRLKSYYFVHSTNQNQVNFPSVFDVTIGQNEYITGGIFRGTVLHGSAFFALPKYPVYIFSSLDLSLSKERYSNAPALFPATNQTYSSTSASIVTVQVPPPNRDRYTIGIAVDLLQIFK